MTDSDPYARNCPGCDPNQATPNGILIACEPICIGVEGAAQLIGVSRRFLDAKIASGALPVARFGRRVTVPLRSLKEFVASHTEREPG